MSAATGGATATTQDRFEKAVNVIRSLPQDGAFKPSDMVKLKFYALYKQARQGPNTTAKPGFWDPTGRAKWEAWKMCGTMTKEAAMKMYVEELQQMVEAMPQTPEVEDFLRALAPFSDDVGGGSAASGIIDKEEEQSKHSEDTESDNEEEFHDSMTESQHPPPVDEVTSFQSDTAPNSVHPVLCHPHSPKASPPTTRRKGVHFADEAVSALEPSLVVGAEVPSETLQRLHHNLQMMNEQLGQISSMLRSLQEQSMQAAARLVVERSRARGSARKTLSLVVVCPLAITILLSYLFRRFGGMSLPWWFWGVVTCSQALSSLVLALVRL